MKTRPRTVLCLALLILVPMTNTSASGQAKLTAEDVISRHVASLGSKEAIAANTTRVIQGTSVARVLHMSIGNATGTTVLVSTGEKRLIRMSYKAISGMNDWSEVIAWDGRRLTVPFITESMRSELGRFAYEYPEITKQGLLGGTLLTSWILLDARARVRKMELQGTEKIGETEAYVVKCTPRDSSNLSIKLYFDTQTFRHLRTLYYAETTPPTIVHDEGRISSIRQKLVEDFRGFITVNGMSLPSSYTINFTIESPVKQAQYEWSSKLSRFDMNVEILPEAFQ